MPQERWHCRDALAEDSEVTAVGKYSGELGWRENLSAKRDEPETVPDNRCPEGARIEDYFFSYIFHLTSHCRANSIPPSLSILLGCIEQLRI